jgi:hypothetical protein
VFHSFFHLWLLGQKLQANSLHDLSGVVSECIQIRVGVSSSELEVSRMSSLVVVAGWTGGEAIGPAINGGKDKLGGCGPEGWVCPVGVAGWGGGGGGGV